LERWHGKRSSWRADGVQVDIDLQQGSSFRPEAVVRDDVGPIGRTDGALGLFAPLIAVIVTSTGRTTFTVKSVTFEYASDLLSNRRPFAGHARRLNYDPGDPINDVEVPGRVDVADSNHFLYSGLALERTLMRIDDWAKTRVRVRAAVLLGNGRTVYSPAIESLPLDQSFAAEDEHSTAERRTPVMWARSELAPCPPFLSGDRCEAIDE
jgi:hypothetical protein